MDRKELTTGEWVWLTGFVFSLGIRVGQIFPIFGPDALPPLDIVMFFIGAVGISFFSWFGAGMALGGL